LSPWALHCGARRRDEKASLCHLRAFKTAADREVGLVEQVVSPMRRGRDAAAKGRAEDAIAQMAALSVRLHATLVKSGLRFSR
jgi:hypothetical protein